ncbi:MAG: hypothetical protein IJK85_04765, partial [Bacteroidales bacterium]|nr:hypothetical protein [Bacteroidales bacterium]
RTFFLLKLSLKRRLMRSSFVNFSMLTRFGVFNCFFTLGGQPISGIDIWELDFGFTNTNFLIINKI